MKNGFFFIGIIVLLAGCLQTAEPPSQEKKTLNTNSLFEEREKYDLFEKHAATHQKTMVETIDFFSHVYEIMDEKDIFAELPSPNDEFFTDAQKWADGNTQSLLEIREETYLQPEFYPTFLDTGIKTWIEAPDAYPSIIGIASVPAEQEAVIQNDTNELETVLFVGTAWGTTHYHGLGFYTTIEPESTSNQKIQVQFEPNNVVVGPTFPVFDKEWVKKVTITISIPEKLEPGTYTIHVWPTEPTRENHEKWSQQYTNYVSGAGPIINSKGLAELQLKVEP